MFSNTSFYRALSGMVNDRVPQIINGASAVNSGKSPMYPCLHRYRSMTSIQSWLDSISQRRMLVSGSALQVDSPAHERIATSRNFALPDILSKRGQTRHLCFPLESLPADRVRSSERGLVTSFAATAGCRGSRPQRACSLPTRLPFLSFLPFLPSVTPACPRLFALDAS